MNKRILLGNSLFLFCYRLTKIICFNLIYNRIIYKLFLPHKLSEIVEPGKKYMLVVCHNGGGGTVSYMKNMYEGKPDILFLRNTVSADRDYIYSIENSNKGKRIYIKPHQLKILNGRLIRIHIIAVESYMNLSKLLPWFASHKVPITYDIHDYHCVWYETHFIHNEKYLSKEELEKSVLNYITTRITFQEWHNIWADFFPHVQTITAFSQSSKKIFAEYYPDFEDKVIVKPHSLDYLTCGKIKKLPEKFTIGIFGVIRNADKGSNIVKSFLEFSKDKDYQVYMNGELNPSCQVSAQNIHYMGYYDVSKLYQVILEQGISVVLFPSICPETFSYTVSELIHVEVPVACFDLGAQAEKVSAYKYGQIIKDESNESILEALKMAYEKGQKQ